MIKYILNVWTLFGVLSRMSFVSPDLDHMDPHLARLASLGFTGCLSVVQFNSINPLKAALLHPDTSPVHITGPLVQSSCGSAASAKHHAAENTHHLSGTKLRSHTRLGLFSVCVLRHWWAWDRRLKTDMRIKDEPSCCDTGKNNKTAVFLHLDNFLFPWLNF